MEKHNTKGCAARMTTAICITVSLVFGLATGTAAQTEPQTWYVDSLATCSSGCGLSWASAFATIQEGVDSAAAGDEIWVRQGTYLLSATITVDKAVAIYGGFAGTESVRSERNWTTNITTVDGNNAVGCFYISAEAILDGFTITNGNADLGAGISCWAAASVNNCIISNNYAKNGAGGIFNNADSSITNCIITGNSAGGNLAAILNFLCEPTISHCTIINNAGGIATALGDAYSPVITNCILRGNGEEIFNEGSTPVITYCNIQGGYPGASNIDADPLFDTNYRLRAGSPCIDSGTNTGVYTDMAGAARPQGSGFDMGAYEYPDEQCSCIFGRITNMAPYIFIGLVRLSCGGNEVVAGAIPAPDGYYAFSTKAVAGGGYRLSPDAGVCTFDPTHSQITLPQVQNVPYDFTSTCPAP
ncbi:choice-of-anchor Q domain-containing protein [Thermodesulfobacteriota bacterium]